MKKEYIDLLNERLDQKAFSDLCFDENEIKEYKNWEFDLLKIFDGDPDYMLDENWNPLYFIIIWNRVYYVDYTFNSENVEKLKDFCNWQNPKISLSGCNTRSETHQRKYTDDFESYKWSKIAYRGGRGYIYTCFRYV